jgi:hypothetical protein
VDLAVANASRHEWLAAAGQQERTRICPRYQRTADLSVSTTDPDATHLRQRDGVRLGYQAHYVVDGGKARIILAALVTPAEVPEDWPAADLLWRARFRWRLWPRQATGDKAYGTLALIRTLEDQHIRAYIPLPEWGRRLPVFAKSDFTYDATTDAYSCPGGATLSFDRLNKTQRLIVYRADPATCHACALKAHCTASSRGRTVVRSDEEEYLDRVRVYHETEAYKKALRKRGVWVEPLFAEAKDWHGLRRFRLRRLWRVNSEALLTAAGQNLKRLLSRCGWGRAGRPRLPAGRFVPLLTGAPSPVRSRAPTISVHLTDAGRCTFHHPAPISLVSVLLLQGPVLRKLLPAEICGQSKYRLRAWS